MPVTGTAQYTAVYTESERTYLVRFIDWDGTELQSEALHFGDLPVYTGETPARPDSAGYSYTFAGWGTEIGPVTEDICYLARYESTVRSYPIRFLNWDGTELQAETLEYEAMPAYAGQDPERAADENAVYTFEGWTAFPSSPPAAQRFRG